MAITDPDDARERERAPRGSLGESIPHSEPADALRVARVTPHTAHVPDGITSSVVFGTAWSAILEVVAAHPRWNVVRADSAAGTLEIEITPWFGRHVRALQVLVTLDAVGLTRVAARASSTSAGWRASRDLARFYREVTRSLARLQPA